MSSSLRLGLVGLGKIARDQHLHSIEAAAGIELCAVASRNASHAHLPSYKTLDEMLERAEIDAVSLCTPPQGRLPQALAALRAGKHLMLEKPPGITPSEVRELERIAAQNNLTLLVTWHSRYAGGVAKAKELLVGEQIRAVKIIWKEDVRWSHPGQKWIWDAGGLGIFDPGINALSIATEIFPPLFLQKADLHFPSNCQTPIAAQLRFTSEQGFSVEADFDWRQDGPWTCYMDIETQRKHIRLDEGGARLLLDGKEILKEPDREYFHLYNRFVELIKVGKSDVDLSPFQHVADAFLLGRRLETQAFVE